MLFYTVIGSRFAMITEKQFREYVWYTIQSYVLIGYRQESVQSHIATMLKDVF